MEAREKAMYDKETGKFCSIVLPKFKKFDLKPGDMIKVHTEGTGAGTNRVVFKVIEIYKHFIRCERQGKYGTYRESFLIKDYQRGAIRRA